MVDERELEPNNIVQSTYGMILEYSALSGERRIVLVPHTLRLAPR
jgi:hypothetical protein